MSPKPSERKPIRLYSKYTLVVLLVAGLVSAAAFLWLKSAAAPSDPDSTFNSSGKVSLNLPNNGNDRSYAAKVQADGKVIIGGSDDNMRVVRYDANGNLDTAFGVNGIATVDYGSDEELYDVEIQSDGKILGFGAGGTEGNPFWTIFRLNTNGTLDTSFDGDGKFSYNPGSSDDVAAGGAIQPDGKIVACGYHYTGGQYDMMVIRLNSDGTFDSTFDTDGIRPFAFSGGTNDLALEVVIQTDGKIVFCGQVSIGNDDFAVVRLNADGSDDTSFDTDGKNSVAIVSGNDDDPTNLALQADGKIVVAGFTGTGSQYNYALARFNTNGSLDTTFDGDGRLETDFASGPDAGYGVAIQSDGKIVMSGYANVTGAGTRLDFGLVRYNTDGSLDTTFDGDGRVATQFNANNTVSRDVIIQPNGKIIAVGYSNWATVDLASARYNTDGSLDTSWGGGKINLEVFNSTTDEGRTVVRQADGKLVVVGRYLNGSNFAIVVARYNTNGTIDTTFGGSGKATTQINSTYPQAAAMQADGKIVVAGFNFTGSNYDFLLVRYNQNGTLDTTFDGDGMRVLDISSSDSLFGVAIQPDGKIVAVGEYLNGSTDDYIVLRFNTDGSLDNSFDTDGRATIGISSTDGAHCVAIQPDGKILAAGFSSPSANDFSVVRYNPNGSLDLSFNTVGYAVIAMSSGADVVEAIALQSDGRIVLAGRANGGASADDFALARLNTNGTLDTSFDIDGKLTTSFSNSNDRAFGVAIQPDGKILTSGHAFNGHTTDYAFARYNSDGSPDNTFNGNGRRFLDFSGYDDEDNGISGGNLLLQPDGKAVVVSTARNGINNDIGIARIDAYTPDPQVQFSLSNYYVNEVSGTATITVTRLGDASASASVDYATSDNTATAGLDYAATSGTLNFASNQSSNTFTIPIINEAAVEFTELVNLTLSNPSAGTNLGSPNTALLNIADNDTAGTIDSVFGTNGKVTTSFDLSSDEALAVAMQSNGKIILAGRSINISNGYYDFAVARYNADGTLDTSFDGDGKTTTAFGSISDSANAIAIQSDGKIILAGYGNNDFAVARYNTNGSPDTSFDGDGKTTTDFYGNADLGFGVAIQPDGQIVVAGMAVNPYTGSDFALARYNSNSSSSLVQFSGTAYSVNEDGATATITVSRTGSSGAVSVDYATSNGTAAAGSDYTASSGTLNWADGDSGSKTFTVSISDDAVFESNETVNLALTNPTGGASLGTPNSAVLTIVDDESQPAISINDVSLSEGDSGTSTATFTVSLSNPTTQTATVNYATADSTATAGSDYISASGTLTFNAGETSKNINVTVNGDTLVEGNEAFNVNLSSAANASISDNQGIGTINEDDAGGTIQFSSATYSVNEGNTTATITVTRTGGAASGVTVDYATSNGTATAGSDYTATSGTLTFDAGDTSKTFNVSITDDNEFEANETINLSLSNVTGGASLGSPSTAALTITETDVCSYSINPTSQSFGFAGGNNSVSVTVINGCSWTAVSNNPWITITGGASGNGNGTVNYSVAQNDNPARTGTITIGGQTFTVNQDAGCLDVSVPTGLTALKNSTLTVPVNVNNTATGREIYSFDFTLTYDPTVLTPLATPFDKSGTLSGSFDISFNSSMPGTLVISGFSTTPLTGSGTLLNLKFNVIGNPASCSSLNLTAFQFNEGSPCVNTTSGQACVINGTISGNVKYVNGTPSQSNVPGVTLTAVGATTISGTTDTDGNYSITGFANGSYTVTPTKTGDVNGISAFDAALNAQYVLGIITLTANQRIAADVSNNGTLSSFDSSLIARYVANIPSPGIAGTWKFVPSSRSYSNIIADQPNQNYDAILMGDISGDWTPPSSFARVEKEPASNENVIGVSLPQVRVGQGTSFDVPIYVQDTTGKGVIAYEFDLTYNPKVVLLQTVPVETAGTLSNNMSVTVNADKRGVVKVAVFGTIPANDAGFLLKLKFTAVGRVGSSTSLGFEKFIFNENNPQSRTTNGEIVITDPAASSEGVCGKVTDESGKPFGDVVMKLSNLQSGEEFTTLTNRRGIYCFESVKLSADYVIQPLTKKYTFAPSNRTFTHTERREDIDFIVMPNQMGLENKSDMQEEDGNFIVEGLKVFFEKALGQGGRITIWRNSIED